MRSDKRLLFSAILLLLAACGGGGGSALPPAGPAVLKSLAITPRNPSISTADPGGSGGAGNNIVPVTVNGAACSNSYPNKPCVSVTVCTAGGSIRFSARGVYSDNSTRDLTMPVLWSSGTPSVATIDPEGNVVAVAQGTSVITASTGTVSGSTTLTVTGCQTINDILLDTGSFGLRLFKQTLSISLSPVNAGTGSLAECVQFADGSSEWGPVRTAGLILASEPSVTVSIHVIDQSFGGTGVPAGCRGARADTGPIQAGFNGILGVGLFEQDCGNVCADSADNGQYYSCKGSTCSGAAAPPGDQVRNPVALLPADNNGVIVRLPAVPSGGAPSVTGSLILGIGTQTDNQPSGVTAYPANQVGEFVTAFNNKNYSSFVDSGSNGIFFPSPSASVLPVCPSPNASWFCPSSVRSLSATTKGDTGSPANDVAFSIGNFVSLTASSNRVFNDIGGNIPSLFDWGLPFYFGRDVFVGIEGRDSKLGTGPYWAY